MGRGVIQRKNQWIKKKVKTTRGGKKEGQGENRFGWTTEVPLGNKGKNWTKTLGER